MYTQQRPTDIKNVSAQVQKGMQDRARETGSQAVQHTADVLKAQHQMMVDKKLVERFDRIGKRLEEIHKQSPQDFDRTRRQIESLRPLLRLSVRSVNFRNTLLSFLRVMKHVWEQNVEGSMETVLQKGEQQGVRPAAEEAKRIGERTWDNLQSKQKVISDQDWEKMTDQLDKIFSELHRHPDFQRGITQLFELPSVLDYQVRQNVPSGPTEQLKEESKELIAQFSGREILDQLFDKIHEVRVKFENSQEAQEWWKDFRNIVEKIAKEYSDKSIFDELRTHLNKSQDIFEDFRPQLNEIIDMITTVFDNMSNDEYVRDLQERLSIVADDLYWVDSEGNKRLDVDAAGDVTAAVGEALRQQLSHLSLGDVGGEGQGARYRLADLNIDAKIPEKLEFHLESDAVLNTARDTSSTKRFESELNLTTTLRGIQMCAKNIHFWYESSTISDSGIMDVCIPSADLTIDFDYSPTVPKDTSGGYTKELLGGSKGLYQFMRAKTTLSVSDLDINYHTDTLRHTILVPMLTGLFKPYLIGRFESGIQDAMNDGLKEVGTKISQLLSQSPYSLSINSTLTRGLTVE
jgi:hypothetical protein